MEKIVLSVLALLFFLTTGCGGKAGQAPGSRTPAKELTLATGQSLDSYGNLGNDLADLVSQDGKVPAPWPISNSCARKRQIWL